MIVSYRIFGPAMVVALLTGCAATLPTSEESGVATPTAALPQPQPQAVAEEPAQADANPAVPEPALEAGMNPLAPAQTSIEEDDGARPDRFQQSGVASFYARKFQGRRTASGERYNAHALTAAHRTLPMGSYARVTVAGSSRSVVVRINDRGPYARGRVIDLSYAAAAALGLPRAGTLLVNIERVGKDAAGS
jgi:rare lipoprotein A